MNSVKQIEDHPLVSFLPLDLSLTESLETVVSHIDYVMQYGEDEEPKEVCCRLILLSIFSFSFLASRHGRRGLCRYGVEITDGAQEPFNSPRSSGEMEFRDGCSFVDSRSEAAFDCD